MSLPQSKNITFDRNKCVINGSYDLETIDICHSFPIKMGCTDQPQDLDIKVDMEWAISKSSGLIQLKKLIPLDLLYSDQHGPGTVGSSWKLHHKLFAKFLSNYDINNVLEIGGGHGILSVEYNKIKNTNWSIIEPNPSPVKDCKAKFIKGFFDENFCNFENYNSYIHSHLLEHL